MITLGANSKQEYSFLDDRVGMVDESLIHWATHNGFVSVVKDILKSDKKAIIYLRNLQTPLDYCNRLMEHKHEL